MVPQASRAPYDVPAPGGGKGVSGSVFRYLIGLQRLECVCEALMTTKLVFVWWCFHASGRTVQLLIVNAWP